MKKITKNDLILKLADKTDLNQSQSRDMLNTVLDIFSEELAQHNTIAIPGFGSFLVADRAARTARNPKTGEEMVVPAAKVPRFKPGKQLKELVQKS